MKISFPAARRNQSGWALIITLTFALISLIVFASIMYWATSSARVSRSNNLFNISQAAAQGAAETAISEMDRDFVYGSLNSSNYYELAVTNINQSSWPVQFIFGDTFGNTNQIYVSIWPQLWATNYVNDLGSQFEGLYGAAAQCTVIAMATPINQGQTMNAIVTENLNLALIPVFQFAVFYNLDLDFSPGQPLTMNGKVHCNGTIWMCPQANAYFNNVVEAAGVVTNSDDPNDQQNLTFSSSYLHYTVNPVSRCDRLNLPINGVATNSGPTNVETLFNLPATAIAVPSDAAYTTTNQVYLYNEADLIISNSSSGINGASQYGTNLSVFFSDYYNPLGRLILVTNDLQWYVPTGTNNVVSTNASTHKLQTNTVVTYLTNCYYSYVTNVSFYDFREGKTVQAIQFDVSKFNLWVTNAATNAAGAYLSGYPWNYQLGGSDGAHGDKGHVIDTVFFYNNVQLSSSQLPAVRVVNGQQLPSPKGLTIATPMPIYVLGNYNIQTNVGGTQSFGTTNTAWTWPAALMGDAITVLSLKWNDTNSAYLSGGSYSSRPGSNTTINAACLEGIVVSTNVAGVKHYSGGLENFLRLLENWNNSSTLTYNGSIVVMFPSIYATNFWIGPGTYYDKPTRNWGFDSNFQYQQKTPPSVPQAKAIIRGNWTPSGQ